MNVYPFIEAERAQQRSVKRACELLKVSRAAYYAHHAEVPSARQQVDAELTERIRSASALPIRQPRPLRRPAHPRAAAPRRPPARPQAHRTADACRRAARPCPAPVHAHHGP